MPDLSNHQSTSVTKLLLIGESGTGKTGSLASLAQAGYNLRIIDLDNGIDVLRSVILDPSTKYPEAKAPDRVRYITLTEPMKSVAGRVIPARAVAWERMVGLLDRWVEYKTDDKGVALLGEDKKPIVEKDLGKLSSWTSQDVLVIDSLTTVSSAAFNFDWKLQGKLGIEYTQNEHRRAIGRAQSLVEHLLQLLSDVSIPCNVIVISHVTYVRDIEAAGFGGSTDSDESNYPRKGYPSALGVALSPRIPRYFNSVLYTRATGAGAQTRRTIHTVPLGVVNVKNSNPLRVKAQYPVETGLAEFFKDVRG